MTTRTSPGRLTARTGIGIAAVWFAIGFAGVAIVGSVMYRKPVLIIPMVVIVAVAVLTAKLAGGRRGR